MEEDMLIQTVLEGNYTGIDTYDTISMSKNIIIVEDLSGTVKFKKIKIEG